MDVGSKIVEIISDLAPSMNDATTSTCVNSDCLIGVGVDTSMDGGRTILSSSRFLVFSLGGHVLKSHRKR